MSNRRPSRSELSGRKRAAAASSAALNATLNQKIARQPSSATSTPPSTGPERERDPRNRRPHAERARPLASVRVDLADQRERARLAGGGADAHHDARRRSGFACRRRAPRPASRRRRGRCRRASPASVPRRSPSVPPASIRPGEGEHVAVEHPLEARDAGAERRLHVRERDADDRVVEERQEQHGADRRERESARVAAWAQELEPAAEHADGTEPSSARNLQRLVGRPATCRSRTRPIRSPSRAPGLQPDRP